MALSPPPRETSPDDTRDVCGQPHANRALEVDAAENHSLLLIGMPGTGKTILTGRLAGTLTVITKIEAVESATPASINDQIFTPINWCKRLFRALHHIASSVALVGGGSSLRPSEVSLAHYVVLFPNEFPEFGRRVLEVLRELLYSGRIIISRAARQLNSRPASN